ncbi:MAG: PAS domain S-box protein [Verrucomicrobiae bacterium]|nr:PAS domain S-box protein [Verrucomicrobiae bacterium]
MSTSGPILEPADYPRAEKAAPPAVWAGTGLGTFTLAIGLYGLIAWVASAPKLTTLGIWPEPLSARAAFVLLLTGSALAVHLQFGNTRSGRCYTLGAAIVAGACILGTQLLGGCPFARAGNPSAAPGQLGLESVTSIISAWALLLACALLGLRPFSRKTINTGLERPAGLVIGLIGFTELLGHVYGWPSVWGPTVAVPRNGLVNVALVSLGVGLYFAARAGIADPAALRNLDTKSRLPTAYLSAVFLAFVAAQLGLDMLTGWRDQNPALRNVALALLATGIAAAVPCAVRFRFRESATELKQSIKSALIDQALPTTPALEPEQPCKNEASNAGPTAASLPAPTPQITEAFWDKCIRPLAAFVIIHQKGRCVFANKTAEEILGRTATELRNCAIWELAHSDMSQLVRDRISRAEADRETLAHTEYQFVRPDGQTRWVEISAQRIEFGGQPAVLLFGLDTTQRKLTEQTLRANEEQFRQVVEHIREVFWMRDYPAKRFIYISPAYETIWGRDRRTLYDSPITWFHSIVPEDRARVQKAWANLRALGTYHEIYRIQRPDGSIRWIEDRAFPVLNDRGAIYRIAGIAEDITERKRAETALKESETTFKTIFAKTSEGMFVLDWDKKALLMCNPACARLLGYRLDEINMFALAQLLHQDDLHAFLEQVAKFAKSGRWQYRDFRFVRKDNSILVADISPALITLGGKKAILVAFKDITKRKQIEDALRTSEERFRTLFESAPIGVALLTPEGRFLQVNRAHCEMLGYPSFKLQKLGVINVVEPNDAPIVQRMLADLAEGKCEHVEHELRFRTADGTTLYVLWAASTARAPSFSTRHIVSTAMDITEAKRLQSEVLEISEQERTRIGHDLHDGLGQYLSGIALKAKCLQQALADVCPAEAEAAGELVRLINAAIGHARALARGLDPGALEPDDLAPALRRLAAECEQIFSVRCHCEVATEPVALHDGEAKHLYMIAQEAVNNAVKHGGASNIAIELLAQNGSLRLLVRDDGAGFEPTQNPDAGLGLRIMKYRAHAIGGTLNIRSCPGTGTEIECILPIARPPSEPQSQYE